MAIDLAPFWDFGNPALSEERFRAALVSASADDALILQTQIARTHGLRRDFAKAREILAAVEPKLAGASAEARVRFALELGRTHASATHPPQLQTPQERERARTADLQAYELAKSERLDRLAIDALHMLAFVDTAPADQLKWGEQALALALASLQPQARAWEASLRNNVGYALHQSGRHDEALSQFTQALALREEAGDAKATGVASWMVAWTLRALGRTDEALAIQLRLESENEAATAPDPHVFDELEQLYRLKGDAVRADAYAHKRGLVPLK